MQSDDITFAKKTHYLNGIKCVFYYGDKEMWFMIEDNWILCPICNSKTRTKVREDTVLENFPLYCPKCKNEHIINSSAGLITIVQAPKLYKNT